MGSVRLRVAVATGVLVGAIAAGCGGDGNDGASEGPKDEFLKSVGKSLPDPFDSKGHQPPGTYVGKLTGGRAYVGLVVRKDLAAIYVCDGRTADWFSASRTGNRIKGESPEGTRVSASIVDGGVNGRVQGRKGDELNFTAKRPREPGTGLFAGVDTGLPEYQRRWIVLEDGIRGVSQDGTASESVAVVEEAPPDGSDETPPGSAEQTGDGGDSQFGDEPPPPSTGINNLSELFASRAPAEGTPPPDETPPPAPTPPPSTEPPPGGGNETDSGSTAPSADESEKSPETEPEGSGAEQDRELDETQTETGKPPDDIALPEHVPGNGIAAGAGSEDIVPAPLAVPTEVLEASCEATGSCPVPSPPALFNVRPIEATAGNRPRDRYPYGSAGRSRPYQFAGARHLGCRQLRGLAGRIEALSRTLRRTRGATDTRVRSARRQARIIVAQIRLSRCR